ncbi:hypothetical protein [Paenibacillus physcomitrellae]|uniref:YfhD family protein n=1 Tax=Paenibacillus physcomitrellae TaxID=1619311 RepID=A0ABQ1FWR3_9BACL|nr:hypothetical protein [Paenibacillus physcomitrellae]GGA32840.1 hypothetical protein GCM10010917_17380 [Paenibacillus physcomitrellae]
MTKDKHQKHERQIASNNGQSDTAGGRGERRAGRKAQFKNHSQDGSGILDEYLDPRTE